MLNVPDTNDRYYTVQLLDAWTNTFANIGRRTTGTKAGKFVIVGPHWQGTLPSGIKKLQSPTDTVWALGRILVKGENDLPEAQSLQGKFTLTTLKGKRATIKQKRNQLLSTTTVEELSMMDFINELNEGLRQNPPSKKEQAILQQFKPIGIDPSLENPLKDMNQETINGLNKAAKDAINIIRFSNTQLKPEGSWQYNYDIGTYGFDYLLRAAVAYSGLGANIIEESMYVRTFVDENGDKLNGKNKYVIHFEKGKLPNVEAFWSLTLYNSSFFLVKNPIKRYAVGDRTEGLRYNADGSLDIYIQHSPPAGKELNWLPAPEGDFNLIMRLYQPGFAILNGSYKLPPVKKVSGA